MFDARELRRWGVPRSRLPAGSLVLYDEHSVLQTYFWQIAGVVAVLLAESLLILSLVLERRRRRAAEQQMVAGMSELGRLSRVAALEGLSGSIAHELNQPLGAILSNAEAADLLLHAEPPRLGPLREIVQEIKKENTRASDIIRAMRALFQKQDFALKQFDLNEVVRNISVLAMWEAGHDNYGVQMELTPELPPVLGDPLQLQQVIFNLVSNAREAMAARQMRTGSIVIRTGLSRDEPGAVELSVRDNGPGIAEQDLGRIFKPHFTTKPNGMGLGLWIAHTIVEAHGGVLRAANQARGGACFWFALPVEETP
jgi:signal transduction histidine kinase